MNVAIYARPLSKAFIPDFKEVYTCFVESSVNIYIYSSFKESVEGEVDFGPNVEAFQTLDDIKDKVDIMISLGGDGTLLDTATLIKDTGIPVIGINFGRLGFLASISKDDLKAAIRSIINRDFSTETRSLLLLKTEKSHFEGGNFALNDINVHKRDNSAMMIAHTYINDVFLNSYWADGLIIATPTGSTAYSLSCGGPIMHPKCDNILVTPISPHNLNVRPMVLSSNVVIDIEVECRGGRYLVSCDSRTEILSVSEKIRVQQAEWQLNLVRLRNESYFATLRNKMMWGLDTRN